MRKVIVAGPFVWDAEKEEMNMIRHGIDFTEAVKAFSDPHRLIIEDLGHSDVEERFYCIGRVTGSVVTVRFTYRGGLTRIIGAGYWRKWRNYYEEKAKV